MEEQRGEEWEGRDGQNESRRRRVNTRDFTTQQNQSQIPKSSSLICYFKGNKGASVSVAVHGVRDVHTELGNDYRDFHFISQISDCKTKSRLFPFRSRSSVQEKDKKSS